MDWIYVDQFATDDFFTSPDPNRDYHLVPGIKDRNVSRLQKLILLVRRYPGLIESIRVLCEDQNHVQHQTSRGITPLFLGCVFAGTYSTPEVVKILLRHGADTSKVPSGYSSLVHAMILHSNYTSTEALDVILQSGVNPSEVVMDRQIRMPLILMAASYGNISMLRTLVRFGASYLETAENGMTAAMTAVQADNILTLSFLLQTAPSILNLRMSDGTSAVMMAAFEGKLEAVQVLVTAGADLEILNSDSETAILIAIRRNHPEIVRYLLEHRARIDIEMVSEFLPISLDCQAILKQVMANRVLMSGSLLDRCLKGLTLMDTVVGVSSLKNSSLLSEIQLRGGQVKNDLEGIDILVTDTSEVFDGRPISVRKGTLRCFTSKTFREYLGSN